MITTANQNTIKDIRHERRRNYKPGLIVCNIHGKTDERYFPLASLGKTSSSPMSAYCLLKVIQYCFSEIIFDDI